MAVIKGGFEIVKRAMLKELMKRGDDGIMLTLPKNELVDLNAKITMDRLIKAGIDPESLTSPDQVLNILENINNQMIKNTRVLSGDEAAKFLNKAFSKKGEVVKFPQKRSFAEEIEAMKKSGDIVDKDNMVISEKITDREMFKEANKKFNKPKTEAEIKTKLEKENKENVAKINKRTMEEDREIENLYGSSGFGNDQKIDAEFLAEYLAENAGKVYDDLPTKERINFYGRAYDALTRYKKNVGRSVIDEPQKGPGTPEFDGVNKDPEDFAIGGRAGHYTGGMVDVEPNLSDIGHGSDALMARTRLVSPGSQATTSTGLNYLLAEDNDNIRVPFANGLHAEKPKIDLKKLRKRMLIHNDQPMYKDRSKLRDLLEALDGGSGIFPGYDVKNDLPKEVEAAEGGRIGFAGGKLAPEGELKSLQAIIPGTALEGLELLNEEMTEEEFLRILKDLGVDKKAEGGRIGFANGNGVADEDAEKAALGKRVRELMDDGFDFGEAVKQAMSEGYAEGGRIGFAAGGGGRRAFLKLMGVLGGGIAGLKSGILGFGGKEGTKKAITETIKQSSGSGTPPPYFFKLVDKIRTMGDDTLATKDKAIAKKYKDYVMEEDFAGNIEIIKKSGDDMFPEDVYMSYKVDDVSIKGKKGSIKAEEYEEFTARPDRDGKMKDIEPGVPDEVVNEGSVFEDNMTEFGMTKKADGGRIGFSAGKLALSKLGITGSSRRFLEKVFGKEG